ncbi:glycosyltransferase [Chryseobacterium sp. FH1]|uniref:glycosyltransferase n=1 Tax=Chryseobacterium sp. FH1 TaxID=1233951 RepID=UPI00068AA31D|nr:glycosyltransferase [Chryseobacterium sp. FH1]
MNDSKALVSVFMISYNQQDYIIEALENVLNQKTDFDFEIILSDDCSTDNTKNVVQDFLASHPNKNLVTFFSQEKNLGWMPNFIFTLQKCKDSGAKYIAMCEGDDFWTNPDKLQKQIDLLENNPDVVLTCHQYKELYNDGSTKDYPYFRKDFFLGQESFKFSQEDFEAFLRIQTMTIVFRNSALDLELRHKYQYYCDTHIKHHILDHGLGLYTKDFDAVYRIHGKNVFASLKRREQSEFAYNVYRDLITNNNSQGYKKTRDIVMENRVKIELETRKHSFFNRYYQQLLLQQLSDRHSFLKYLSNLWKSI